MLKRTPTWQECFDAGMTAPEANEARGQTGAHAWACRRNLKWPPAPPPGTHNAMPCRINGRAYRSQREAAEALGLKPSAISAAIARGSEDRVGTGMGRLGNKNRGRKVELFGQSFASRKDAAAALGLTRARLALALDTGDSETLLVAFMRRSARQTEQALKAAEMVDGQPNGTAAANGRKGGIKNKGKARS